MHREYIPHYGTNLRMKFISALAIGANKGYIKEAISKLLKIVKAPSLRSVKGSVFGCYLTGSNLKLPFTALCEWHLCHFLNDF